MNAVDNETLLALARIDAEAALEKFVRLQPGLPSAVLNTSKGTFVWVPNPPEQVRGTTRRKS